MVIVPRRVPSPPSATAVCTCLWVSTPTMMSACAVSLMATGLQAGCEAWRSTVGQDCDGTIVLKLLSGHIPFDRQVPPGGADTSTRWHRANQGKGQVPQAAPTLSQSRQSPLRLMDCRMPCRAGSPGRAYPGPVPERGGGGQAAAAPGRAEVLKILEVELARLN